MNVTQTSDQELLQLAEAFDTFNLVSSQLEASYSNLESRIADLRRQVSTARRDGRREARSKQRIAARMTTVLESLPGGAIVLDEHGKVCEFNSCAGQWLPGLETGVEWQALSSELFDTRLTNHGDLSLHDGRSLTVAEKRQAEDGCTILLLTDITEKRHLNDVVTRHQRLASLGEMLATLVHQIRTPVTSAMLYASTAISKKLDEDRRLELMGESISCLTDLEALIADMLSFANGHAGSIHEKVGLHDLLQIVERDTRPQLVADQTFSVIAPSSDCYVSGSLQALASALQNLVGNALDASGDAGTVSISASLERSNDLHRAKAGSETVSPRSKFGQQSVSLTTAQNIRIAVSDNGTGLTESEFEKVFIPFYTRKSSGTGLGLSAAQSIVRAHQGDIQVRNNSRGGATFEVLLPVANYKENSE